MTDVTTGTVQPERRRRAIDKPMRIGDLFRDPGDGMMSVVKSCAFGGWVILSSGFIINAYLRDLDWTDMIGYSVGVVITTGAPIASHIVRAVQPRLAGIAGKYAQGNGHAASDDKETKRVVVPPQK